MDLTRRMTMTLAPGESLTKEGPANMSRGLENVGGRLFLTSTRMHFKAHAMNVQTASSDIPLGEIASVERGWTTMWGIPLAKNAIIVTTGSGTRNKFTVQRPSAWVEAIDAQRGRG